MSYHATNTIVTDNVGETALHYACENGNKDTVEPLLQHDNIDVNKADKGGETPLQLASRHDDIAKLFKKHSTSKWITVPQYRTNNLTKAEQAFSQAVSANNIENFLLALHNMIYYLAHACEYLRGSAACTDILTRAMCKHIADQLPNETTFKEVLQNPWPFHEMLDCAALSLRKEELHSYCIEIMKTQYPEINWKATLLLPLSKNQDNGHDNLQPK